MPNDSDSLKKWYLASDALPEIRPQEQYMMASPNTHKKLRLLKPYPKAAMFRDENVV